MSESEVFGAPAGARSVSSVAARRVSHLAPVPMFDPLLQAARDAVQALGWFRREIGRAETMCSNMEQVVEELLASKIAEDAAKHVQASVVRLREQITKASNYCTRLENLAAELQGGEDDTFALPHVMTTGRGKAVSVASE